MMSFLKSRKKFNKFLTFLKFLCYSLDSFPAKSGAAPVWKKKGPAVTAAHASRPRTEGPFSA
jgi:hypothetical protein